MARKVSNRNNIEALTTSDRHRVYNLARVKYKDRDIDVRVHPQFPLATLKSADEAVYQIWTRLINTLDWSLAEQGVLPALFRGLK